MTMLLALLLQVTSQPVEQMPKGMHQTLLCQLERDGFDPKTKGEKSLKETHFELLIQAPLTGLVAGEANLDTFDPNHLLNPAKIDFIEKTADNALVLRTKVPPTSGNILFLFPQEKKDGMPTWTALLADVVHKDRARFGYCGLAYLPQAAFEKYKNGKASSQ